MSAADAYFLTVWTFDTKHRPIRTALLHGTPGGYGAHHINN